MADIPVWPAELPQKPLKDGYGRGFADGRLFQSMGQGPAKVRRRYSAAVRPVAAGFVVDANGAALLERFWEDDTAGGSLPFLLRDPVNDGQPLLTDDGSTLLTDTGVALLNEAWWLVMFAEGPPQMSVYGGNLYRVSLQLNVMP